MAASQNSVPKLNLNSQNFEIVLVSIIMLLALSGCLGGDVDKLIGELADTKVKLQFLPENPIAGQETTIEILLADKDGKPLTDLQIDHERILHMIIVGKDFRNFAHIHAEDFGDVSRQVKEGKLTIKHVFPESGTYNIVVEFKRPKMDYVFRQDVFVGDGGQKIAVVQPEFSRKKKFGDYEITFSVTPEKPKSKEMAMLNYHVEMNGQPVQDLEYYLAAKSHISIWSSDFSKFIHTHAMDEMMSTSDGMAEMDMEGHPMGNESDVEEHSMNEMAHSVSSEKFGPDVMAHVTFPQPGLYKVFAQFNHQGKVFAADFWVKVE